MVEGKRICPRWLLMPKLKENAILFLMISCNIKIRFKCNFYVIYYDTSFILSVVFKNLYYVSYLYFNFIV
jgi:hypothetical protein